MLVAELAVELGLASNLQVNVSPLAPGCGLLLQRADAADKQMLQTVNDALQKQQAEDQSVPGLATAELMKRSAALMGSLKSGQATAREKEQLQTVNDVLQKQKAERNRRAHA